MKVDTRDKPPADVSVHDFIFTIVAEGSCWILDSVFFK